MRCSISPRWAPISSRCRSFTARPTRCSGTSCRARALPCALPNPTGPRQSKSSSTTNTRGDLLRERRQPGGQHLRHRSAGRASPQRHGIPLVVDNTVATPILLRPDRLRRRYRGAFADQVYGRARHHAWRRYRRQRQISLEKARAALSAYSTSRDASYHGLVYADHFGEAAYIARCRSVYQRTTGAVLAPLSAFLLAARHRNGGAAGRAPRRERAPRRRISCAQRSAGRVGQLCGLCRQSLSCAGARNISAAALARC